jgi:hypothetical protein
MLGANIRCPPSASQERAVRSRPTTDVSAMQLKEARDHGFKNYQDYQDFLPAAASKGVWHHSEW